MMTRPPEPTRYEYRSVEDYTLDDLNTRGRDGWYFVGGTVTSSKERDPRPSRAHLPAVTLWSGLMCRVVE